MDAKYKLIYNQVRDMITSEKYGPGDMLPAEMKMVEQCGVSRITIQKALKMLVDEGLIERISGKGTFVKQTSVVKKDQKTFALILPINNPEMTLLLDGAQKQAESNGYDIKIYFTDKRVEYEPEVIASAIKNGASGVIIYPYSSRRNVQYYRSAYRKIPLVFIDKRVNGVVVDTVMSNNFEGAYEAANYLIRCGHKHIAYMDYDSEDISLMDRKNGYLQALTDNGIEKNEKLIIHLKGKKEVEEAFGHFFADPASDDVTAFFFGTDETALNGIYYLNQLGKSVPSDISVCGFDNSYLGRSVIPALTTVAQDFSGIGANAAKLLFEKIEGGNDNCNVVYVPAKLVIRDSVKDLTK